MRQRALLALRLPPRSGAVADDAAGGRFDGAGAAQGSEGCVAVHPVGVIACGDEQTSRGFGSHAAGGEQSRVGLGAQAAQPGIEAGDLGCERFVAPRQTA